MFSYMILSGSILITPFYDSKEQLFELTNFSKHNVVIQNIDYPTTEHYFQAQKFAFPKDNRLQFLQEVKAKGNGPMDALKVARSWTQKWSNNDWNHWNGIKESVMSVGLRAKIHQHPQIANLLLETGNTCLVEDTGPRNEQVWGWGADGKGSNQLGRLWMQIRNELHIERGRQDLVVDVDKLYKEAQIDRIPLGIRKTIMQTWPDVKQVTLNFYGKPPAFTSAPQDIIALSKIGVKHIKKGQRFKAKSSKGQVITYGVSKQFGTFYIRGKNKKNKTIDVYVKNNKIYENNKVVKHSPWATWALPIVYADMKKRKLI